MAELDLNLLRVLKVLLETQNTYRAAETLHVSQSSISKSLAKLRDYFNDPLFVRDKFGLKPTVRAEELGLQLPSALNQLNQVLDNNRNFEPKEIDSVITIAMNSFLFNWLSKDIYYHLNKQAPNMELHLIHWNDECEERLIKGTLEIGVNYISSFIGKQIHQQSIFTDDFVFVVRKDHPMQEEIITPKTFDKYQVASLIVPSWNYQTARIQELVKHINENLKISLRSTNFDTLLEVLAETDLILPCPLEVAKSLDKSKYRYLPISIDLPVYDGAIVFLTDKVRKEDRLIKWLSRELKTVINNLTEK